MADFQSNFVPAFKYPIKWSVGDNTFDDSDKNPKTIGLAIAVESIPEVVSFLLALEGDTSKHKQGKVWSKENGEEKKTVVYINGKGKESNDGYGCFGNINPRKIEVEPPF
jgi:hypothetical protein|tara:strand:- start:162 stop:491 length:330 start_codon:yes stop_codon:yes gene_type:complete